MLDQVRRGQLFQRALDDAVANLAAADRHLAHEIAAGVLRRRRLLDRRLAPLMARGWDRTPEGLKTALRIGAYQLLALTRVPRYAAVATTVALAKQTLGIRAARTVNAVLRRLRPDKDGAGEGAAGPTHPQWLLERWRRRFGPERTAQLVAHNDRTPALTIQPARWALREMEAALLANGIPFGVAPLGHGLTITGCPVRRLPGYTEGGFVVQDAGQAYLLDRAEIPAGSRVWDACASPGGKAAVLAGRCRVVASDSRRSRLARLLDTLGRAAPGVPVLLADGGAPPLRPGAVDVVLVDAPCSATGTMARHPDARWRLRPGRIAWLVQRQRHILAGVTAALQRGGRLVYMTCSLEREENEDQVDRFLEVYGAFEREGDDVTLFPPDAGTDGGFVARMRRR